jgi:hypothetical protein
MAEFLILFVAIQQICTASQMKSCGGIFGRHIKSTTTTTLDTSWRGPGYHVERNQLNGSFTVILQGDKQLPSGWFCDSKGTHRHGPRHTSYFPLTRPAAAKPAALCLVISVSAPTIRPIRTQCVPTSTAISVTHRALPDRSGDPRWAVFSLSRASYTSLRGIDLIRMIASAPSLRSASRYPENEAIIQQAQDQLIQDQLLQENEWDDEPQSPPQGSAWI